MNNTFEEFNLYKIIETIKPSGVTVIAGAPGSGKTTLALNIATQYGVCEGKNIVIFSLEMYKKHIIRNILCAMTGVNRSSVNSGNMTVEERNKMTQASIAIAQSNVIIDDNSEVNPRYIADKIEGMVASGKSVDIVVVDYLQLLSPNMERLILSKIDVDNLVALEETANKYSVPILVVVQMVRRDYKYKPINEITGELTLPRYKSSNAQWLILKTDDKTEQFDVCVLRGENDGKTIPVMFDRKVGRFTER